METSCQRDFIVGPRGITVIQPCVIIDVLGMTICDQVKSTVDLVSSAIL